MIDYDDGMAEGEKGNLELATMVDVERLVVNPANAGGTTDEDDDDNFFYDDLSD